MNGGFSAESRYKTPDGFVSRVIFAKDLSWWSSEYGLFASVGVVGVNRD